MSSDLGEYLKSINTTKENIMDSSGAPEAAEKLYPRYPITKSLSYAKELIFLVNEVNCLGLAQHGMTNRQHYMFFLNVVPKARRFNKWTKKEDDVELVEELMKKYKCSREVAREYAEILSTKE